MIDVLKEAQITWKINFIILFFGFQLRKLPFCPVSMYPDNSWLPPSGSLSPQHSAVAFLPVCTAQDLTPFLPLPVGEWLEANVGSIVSPPSLNFSLEIVVELASQLCIYLQHQTCLRESLTVLYSSFSSLSSDGSSASPTVSHAFIAVFVHK